MKKISILLLLATFSLVGCNNSAPSVDPTPEPEPEPEPTHEHTYSDEWSKDETYHWHQATCEHKDLFKDKEEHKFSDWEIIVPSRTTETVAQRHRFCEICEYEQKEVISPDDFEYVYKYDSRLIKGEIHSMNLHYLTADFNKDNVEFNNNLAINSLASSVASRNIEVADKFYKDLFFKDIYHSDGYDKSKNDELIAYTFASKEIDDQILVAVSIRGFEYDNLEVLDNFRLGGSGEHYGFYRASNFVSSDLLEYISQDKYAGKTFKYWITGFSRAGAVADLLTVNILDELTKFSTSDKDIFEYSFESPKYGVDSSNKTEVIHDVINENDLIPYVPFDFYGFMRYGHEYKYKDENLVTELNETYPNLKLKEFGEYVFDMMSENYVKEKEDGFKDPIEFYNNLITFLTQELILVEDDELIFGLRTRDEYVSTFQTLFDIELKDVLTEENFDKLMHFKEYFDESELTALKSQLIALAISIMYGADQGNELETVLVSILDKLEITYDAQSISYVCGLLQKVLKGLFLKYEEEKSELYPSITGKIATTIGNFSYIFAMHMPESIYILLNK